MMDAENPNRIWIVPLDLVFKDREGFTVRFFRQPFDMIARWRWQRNA